MGLLQAVCFVFKGKSAGLSLADKDNSRASIYLHGTYMALYSFICTPKFFIILRAA